MMRKPFGITHIGILNMIGQYIERRSTILPTFIAFPSPSFVISTCAIMIGTSVFGLIKSRQ